MAIEAREQEADRAAAVGDFARARSLLEEAARSNPANADFWMKLSALRRAAGDIQAALVAIERSLAITPLDFTALLQRALILEQLGDARAPDVFGHALAQLPPGADVPAGMRQVIAHARERWTQHSAAIEQRLNAAIPATIGSEARRRAERLASNHAHTTRHFHQEPTDFQYPGVPEIEFHERANFPQLDLLEAATDSIRDEFNALMAAEAAEMVPYIQ